MIGSSPSYYEEVPANEALREASEPAAKGEADAVDILPFQALGGRRFEILTYLMLLDPLPPVGVTVSLVKASGDQGRDVITHANGKLKSVIQCKALESPLSRPALVRELMKLAVYDSKQSFIPRDGIDYEIWAPGGLTGPAQKLIQEWPNSLTEEEAKAAFHSNKEDYKALGDVKWEDCAEYVLIEFPLRTNLIPRDGLRLSFELRNKQRLFAHFFQVNVVFNREDVKTSLSEMGIRPAFDEDILRVLKDIEGFDKDKRTFLGPHVFGLSLQHFALMDRNEVKLFMEAALQPYSTIHKVLLSSLQRYVEKKTTELRDSVSFASPNFPYLVLRVLHIRMVSRVSRNLSPKTVNVRPSIDDDDVELSVCAERIITKFWDEFGTVTKAYDPSQHARGSDPEYRARIAAHARLGAETRDAFENAMRNDFSSHIEAIAAIDDEILGLIPQRVMVLTDTTLPFDRPDALMRMAENFRLLETLKADASKEPTKGEDVPSRGLPVLEAVTWSPVDYRDGALFRGYSFALTFRGSNFSNQAEFAHRRKGEAHREDGSDIFWRKPNLLVANYAEVSMGGAGTEAPLNWYGYEFAIRNSPDQCSDWITFEYPFDMRAVHQELEAAISEGRKAREEGKLDVAELNLRKAWVFADRLFGSDDTRAKQLFRERESNLDELLLSKLRYRVGDTVRIRMGDRSGTQGVVRKIQVRHKFAYEIEDAPGNVSSVSDEQLD
jgi:hypothetical protein